MDVTFSTTVCGGFPVEVVATVYPAEPDVGLSGSYVEDWELFTLAGCRADFIERKLSVEDIAHITELALEQEVW